MEAIRKVNEGEKFTHATVGDLSAFTGKQFVKDCVGTTGCEISFSTLNPGEAAPFFHSHKQNEEVYLILQGSGDFQVDDTAFPIAEGSIVRVATHCNRSLDQCTLNDGIITEQATAWK